MSEILNVSYILMALNNFKCNHLMPLHFKGLNRLRSRSVALKRFQTKFGGFILKSADLISLHPVKIELQGGPKKPDCF